MHQILIAVSAALLLSACAPMVNTPVRSRSSHADDFVLLKAGRVDPAKTQAVADCLHDGFAGAHGIFTNSAARINRRAVGYRVETVAGGALVIMSADVMDDGTVELYESKNAALINTRGEREAFEACTGIKASGQK